MRPGGWWWWGKSFLKPLFLCCSNICSRGNCHQKAGALVSLVGSCVLSVGRGLRSPPWGAARLCPNLQKTPGERQKGSPQPARRDPPKIRARPPPSPKGSAFPPRLVFKGQRSKTGSEAPPQSLAP